MKGKEEQKKMEHKELTAIKKSDLKKTKRKRNKKKTKKRLKFLKKAFSDFSLLLGRWKSCCPSCCTTMVVYIFNFFMWRKERLGTSGFYETGYAI
jgi:hypothetical protein